MPTQRANWFVGLPVSAQGWLERVPDPPRGARLFAAGDLHATVAFLGAVDEDAARRGFAQARAWPTGPLTVRLGAVRPFGSKRQPSALSVVLAEGHEAVAGAMAEVRDEILASAGARPDSRPPLPHITLARIGRRARPEERRQALAWAGAIDLGRIEIRLGRLALYTWSLDRRRSLFRIIDSFDLISDRSGGQPGVARAEEDA